jgi:hypothetical protein
MAMTNISHDEQLQLDAAIIRIVDERGDGNDWRIVTEASKNLGEGVVLKAAQYAALKLRASRVDPTCNHPPCIHKPRHGTSPRDKP